MKYFDKLCQKCGETKHISKFKSRSGKARRYCDTCSASKILTCVVCQHAKPLSDFYTNASIYEECYECKHKSAITAKNRMDLALITIHENLRGICEYANKEI
jgi:hypothetical protein